MKKLLISIAVTALALPAFSQTTATQGRMAVIDVQRVLNTSVAGKAAQERLKKLQEDKVARANKIDSDWAHASEPSDNTDRVTKRFNEAVAEAGRAPAAQPAAAKKQ